MSTGTKLTDLNEYLFAQIKRLNDDDLVDKEQIDAEIQKSQAITNIATTIIKNGELALKTAIVMQKMGGMKGQSPLPAMLTCKDESRGSDESL